MEERVTVAIADGIAEVRLNRPDKRNALDPAMFAAIAAAIDRLAAEPGLRAVILAGEGHGFCAGLDLAAMAGGGPGLDLLERAHGPVTRAQRVAWGWRTLPVPVIAALHGMALGGGLQIAAGADIRIAHPATRLSVRELHWGIVPDMAGFALWRGTVRDDSLRELTYTAREFDAAEAARLGFVTRLADDPLAAARMLAAEIARRSPEAIRAAKRLFAVAADANAAAILRAEAEEQARLIGSADQREQVAANLEGRSARFASERADTSHISR
jgi:enoyl-CoA hydratase/carnithine racemase